MRFTHRDPRLLRAALVCALLALVCFALLVSDCAAQERHVQLKAWSVAYVGAGVADVALTHAILSRGVGYERNPLYRGSTARMIAVKSATTSGVLLGAWTLRQSHPKAALGLLVGLTAVQVGVDVHNARVLKR